MNNIVMSKLSILLLTVLLIAGSYYFIGKMIIILMPFIIGLLISKMINPAVTFLKNKLHVPRGLSTIVLIFGAIFGIGFGLVVLSGRIARQLIDLSSQFPIWGASIESYVNRVASALNTVRFGQPGTISDYISKAVDALMSRLGEVSTVVGSSILSAVTSVPNILFFIVIMFVSAFFMTKDRELIDKWLEPIFHGEWTRNEKTLIIKKDVLGVIWGYVKAQLILMSLTFVESSIGLLIIGVNYAVPIAFGIALIDALPILGPATIYIPWIISKIVIGEYATAVSLLVLYLVVTLARQALEPKILSTQIGVYPLVTLLSMYIGLKTIGFAGIILGPITVIIILSLFKTGLLPKPAILEHNSNNNENNSA